MTVNGGLDVVVVIVTHNSRHVIHECLDSLAPSLLGLEYRVVVVDNGSTDGTADMLSARADITLIRDDNRGYAAGINRGVEAQPDAEAILVLNPDTRMGPDSAVSMWNNLQRAGVGIVVPRVYSPDGTLQLSLRREPSIPRALGLTGTGIAYFSEYVGDPVDYQTGRVVDWALGAVMLVSMKCHRHLGGWDESYFLYSEETDFCLRARAAGLSTWFDPTARAMHIGAASGQSPRTATMKSVNRVRLYRRRHGVAATALYFGLTVAAEAIWGIKDKNMSVFLALLNPARRPTEINAGKLLPK